MERERVLEFLREHRIAYILHEHPAVYTTEQARIHCGTLPGMHCKNLFLRDGRKRRFFLYSLPAGKQADLQSFAEAAGVRRVSFAGEELLMEKLGLEPGSVTPFGLLNDTACDVEFFIDRSVYEAETVLFHPNRNTATLELTGTLFRRFLELSGNSVTVID